MQTFTDNLIASADPPSTGIANPIHDGSGAAAAGYAGALVAGVRTYGWAAQTIARAVGDAWLESGWIDFRLHRPLFAGETLAIEVTQQGRHWRVECVAGEREDRRIVLDGTAGLDNAPWLAELDPPDPAPGQTPPDPRPTYTLETVPLRSALRPLATYVSHEAALGMVLEDLALETQHLDRYLDLIPAPVHPYFLAGRMAPLTRHNFTYGPTIHVRSQIQHRRMPRANRAIVVGAQITDAYERNLHWYQVLDGVVTDEDGEVCRIRHHTIFRPRGT